MYIEAEVTDGDSLRLGSGRNRLVDLFVRQLALVVVASVAGQDVLRLVIVAGRSAEARVVRVGSRGRKGARGQPTHDSRSTAERRPTVAGIRQAVKTCRLVEMSE